MTPYKMYLANTNGQKISGYTEIKAATFAEARTAYRAMCDAKKISRAGTAVLAVI